MHICFISPHSDPQASLGEPDAGGQCVYQHELAQALSELPEVFVTTFCRDVGIREAVTKVTSSYHIHRIAVGPTGFIPKEALGKYLAQFAQNVVKVIQISTNNEQSRSSLNSVVLHGHYWDGGAAAMYCKTALPDTIPIVWSPHSLGIVKRQKFQGMEEEFRYHFIPRLFWENYVIQAAEHIVVSSEQEAEIVQLDYAIEQEKIAVIRPGISLNNLKRVDQIAARKKLHLPLDAKILLCMGRISPFKGYHHAIDALSEVAKRSSENILLVILGAAENTDVHSVEEREYLARLRTQARSLNLQDRVLFRPAIAHDSVSLAYCAADIQLLMAEYEPYGLTALEAMACKTPVIATKNGGPRSFIKHNQTGNLVDVQQPRTIASYILSLLNDEDFYRSVQEAAHRYATTSCSWKQTAEDIHEIYSRSLKVQKTPPLSAWIQNDHMLQTVLGFS